MPGPVSTWMGDHLRMGKPSRYVTSYPGQLSLAIPPWVGGMSTSESWEVNRHTARYTYSPVSVVSQCKLMFGWRLIRKRRSAPTSGLCGSGGLYSFLLIFVMPHNKMHGCDWSKFRHVVYSQLNCSRTGQYFLALNSIALQNGHTTRDIFPALNDSASWDLAHIGIATPTTNSLIFLNNSWNH